MDISYSILLVAIISLVTMAIRFLPVLIFGREQQTSELIAYLGESLPYAIIGMLVVYCMKDISFLDKPYGIPELIAVGAVILLHLWKRKTLLSVIGGTVIYMVLIHLI